MKVYKKYDEIVLLTGNEPFSVFACTQEDLFRYDVSEKRQESLLFSKEEKYFGESDRTPLRNQGERILEFFTNSKEEKYELLYLFRKEGFKVWTDEDERTRKFVGQEIRQYFNPNNLKIREEESITTALTCCGGGIFGIRLFRKDTKKLLNFFKILSVKFRYKMVYWEDRRYSKKLYKVVIK